MRVNALTCQPSFSVVLLRFLMFFCILLPLFAVEKATLEAEKAAKDAAAREAEFINRAAFLTQNVRGKIFRLSILPVYSNVYRVMLIFVSAIFAFVQKQHASQHLWIRRVAECHSTQL